MTYPGNVTLVDDISDAELVDAMGTPPRVENIISLP